MNAERAVRVVAAPYDREPSFDLDAIVVETDTELVLGADPFPRESDDPLTRLDEAAARSEPWSGGSVVPAPGSPPRLLAVVHDLEREPSWREEWVEEALREVLRIAEARGLEALALPMLGTLHGALEPARFAELFAGALDAVPLHRPTRIWLVLPPTIDRRVLAPLRPWGVEP